MKIQFFLFILVVWAVGCGPVGKAPGPTEAETALEPPHFSALDDESLGLGELDPDEALATDEASDLNPSSKGDLNALEEELYKVTGCRFYSSTTVKLRHHFICLNEGGGPQTKFFSNELIAYAEELSQLLEEGLLSEEEEQRAQSHLVETNRQLKINKNSLEPEASEASEDPTALINRSHPLRYSWENHLVKVFKLKKDYQNHGLCSEGAGKLFCSSTDARKLIYMFISFESIIKDYQRLEGVEGLESFSTKIEREDVHVIILQFVEAKQTLMPQLALGLESLGARIDKNLENVTFHELRNGRYRLAFVGGSGVNLWRIVNQNVPQAAHMIRQLLDVYSGTSFLSPEDEEELRKKLRAIKAFMDLGDMLAA